jgi:hypothetical protein
MFSKPLVLCNQSADDATAGCRVMLFISHGSCVVDAVFSGIWHDFSSACTRLIVSQQGKDKVKQMGTTTS